MTVSKRLVEAVLEKELFLEHLWGIDKNSLLYYTEENGGGEYINVHELSYLCKVWAYENGFTINSSVYAASSLKNGKRTYRIFGVVNMIKDYECSFEKIFANSEPEAIFKACQWILDNKDI